MIAAYGSRAQTRYAHLAALREVFGFADLTPARRREVARWLLPVALASTSAATVAAALLDETRRRCLIVPGPLAVEELAAAALTSAERHVARQLTQGLSPAQAEALDALLVAPAGAPMSVLAWARQPPGVAWAIALSPAWSRRSDNSGRSASTSPAPRASIRSACDGSRARAGASRRSTYAPCRRVLCRATLVATVLDTISRLTDDGVGVFDRAVGRMFRRAEIGEQDALLRDARAAGDKVRLLAKLGAALIEARDAGADLEVAVADAVGWDRLARGVAEAERLARPDKTDLPALAARAWPVLHRLGPLFLGAFRLRAVPAAARTLRAVDALREVYASGGRRWPRCPPTSFLRPAWRDAVHEAEGTARRRTWEAATLLALRDRLRAGDVWVEGSRQWRAVEDQLIPPALFAAMRDAGPLPVAVPATAEEYCGSACNKDPVRGVIGVQSGPL